MKIELLYEDSQMPLRAHPNDAGMDLYAHLDEDVIIGPGCMYKIGSGVAIQPPKGTFGAMFARSGLSTKQGLRLANGVGVCDESYTGEYTVPLYNDSKVPQTVKNGDRIAQVVFIPYVIPEEIEVGKLETTERGEGGFGSSGV